jgi:hypothetical protein
MKWVADRLASKGHCVVGQGANVQNCHVNVVAITLHAAMCHLASGDEPQHVGRRSADWHGLAV